MNYITIDNGKIKFKVGYDGGKFKRIERVRGVLDNYQLKQLGKIIPPQEVSIDTYANTFPQLKYERVTKQPTPFKMAIDAWNNEYQKWHDVPPKINGTETKALKQILSYLNKITGNNDQALELWIGLLQLMATARSLPSGSSTAYLYQLAIKHHN